MCFCECSQLHQILSAAVLFVVQVIDPFSLPRISCSGSLGCSSISQLSLCERDLMTCPEFPEVHLRVTPNKLQPMTAKLTRTNESGGQKSVKKSPINCPILECKKEQVRQHKVSLKPSWLHFEWLPYMKGAVQIKGNQLCLDLNWQRWQLNHCAAQCVKSMFLWIKTNDSDWSVLGLLMLNRLQQSVCIKF